MKLIRVLTPMLLALMRKRVALELQRLDLDRHKALLEPASEELAGRQAQAALDKQRAERERTTSSYDAGDAPALDFTDTR